MKNLLLMLVAATAVLARPGGGVAEPVSADSPIIANDIIPGNSAAAAQGAQPGAIPSEILRLGADFPYEVRSAGPDGYCYETGCRMGYNQKNHVPCMPKWVDKGLFVCYYSFGNIFMRRKCCTV
ncbi:hypothetical protein BZA77DRAFT_354336 [Pyronema omphalodes]|nr:hypothetical protein BZA77DRAFT_354336 [Pyronema omphalodes]